MSWKWVGLISALLTWHFPTKAETPASLPSPEPERVVLVVAAKIKDLDADHYQWAAELAAARLKGSTKVVDGGLAGGIRFAKENPDVVRGIVEVMIDVYSFAEEVRITCMDPSGREIWKEKSRFNNGGSEEALARKMLERALDKAEKRPVCGK